MHGKVPGRDLLVRHRQALVPTSHVCRPPYEQPSGRVQGLLADAAKGQHACCAPHGKPWPELTALSSSPEGARTPRLAGRRGAGEPSADHGHGITGLPPASRSGYQAKRQWEGPTRPPCHACATLSLILLPRPLPQGPVAGLGPAHPYLEVGASWVGRSHRALGVFLGAWGRGWPQGALGAQGAPWGTQGRAAPSQCPLTMTVAGPSALPGAAVGGPLGPRGPSLSGGGGDGTRLLGAHLLLLADLGKGLVATPASREETATVVGTAPQLLGREACTAILLHLLCGQRPPLFAPPFPPCQTSWGAGWPHWWTGTLGQDAPPSCWPHCSRQR